MSATTHQTTGPRVLVVDDNPANVDLLARRLERDGYDVATLTHELDSSDEEPRGCRSDGLWPGNASPARA